MWPFLRGIGRALESLAAVLDAILEAHEQREIRRERDYDEYEKSYIDRDVRGWLSDHFMRRP